MEWSKEAEEAVKRVPFFVRPRVKKRVEEEARRQGAASVLVEHVHACRKRYLDNQEAEIKGYQVESCFGGSGCPNRIDNGGGLAETLERYLDSLDLRARLKERINGPLKFHHEFRISISDCPNACSRPQIVDVGFIGASFPRVGEAACSSCMGCVEACREEAVRLDNDAPVIDPDRCLGCGQCIRACPTGTIEEDRRGYRVLLGGKLGRHPRLGIELAGIISPEAALEVVKKCVEHHLRHSRGERFGEVLERTGLEFLGR